MNGPARLYRLRNLFGGRKRDGRGEQSTEPDSWAERARDAYGTMVRQFAIPGEALFREKAPPAVTDRRYAYLWPFSQALAATLDVAVLAEGDGEALARAELMAQGFFAHYWDTSDDPPGGLAYPLLD